MTSHLANTRLSHLKRSPGERQVIIVLRHKTILNSMLTCIIKKNKIHGTSSNDWPLEIPIKAKARRRGLTKKRTKWTKMIQNNKKNDEYEDDKKDEAESREIRSKRTKWKKKKKKRMRRRVSNRKKAHNKNQLNSDFFCHSLSQSFVIFALRFIYSWLHSSKASREFWTVIVSTDWKS